LTESVFAGGLGKNTDGEIYLGGWSTDQLETFNAALQGIEETYGRIAAADYGAQVMKAGQSLKLDPDQINKLMTIDWSQMTLENKDEFKKSVIEMFEESGIEGGEQLFDKL
jgi:hypothetical protein